MLLIGASSLPPTTAFRPDAAVALEPVDEVGGCRRGHDRVLTALAVRTGEATRQVQMVCLDDLVADGDLVRRVHA